jgi:hypothetical protein
LSLDAVKTHLRTLFRNWPSSTFRRTRIGRGWPRWRWGTVWSRHASCERGW